MLQCIFLEAKAHSGAWSPSHNAIPAKATGMEFTFPNRPWNMNIQDMEEEGADDSSFQL